MKCIRITNNRTLSVISASLLLISLLLLVPSKIDIARAPTGNQVKIGAYYYAWWGMGINDHWVLDDIKGTPFLGNVSGRDHYNSSDPTIADQQILLAEQHRIDFFAVSWAGEGEWLNWDFSVIDYNLRNGLLKAAHMQSFNFCLNYETVLVLSGAHSMNMSFTQIFLEDMNYSLQYFNNSSYLRVNGDPVIFIYQVPYLYENMNASEVHQMFDNARQELANKGVNLYIIGDIGSNPMPPDANSSWLYSLNATTSYHYSDGYETWNQPLQNAETYYPQWLSTMTSKGIGFVPDAYPGSNTTNNRNVLPQDQKVLPRNASAFREMLNVSINNTSSIPGFVMITSWNEWMEGTQIEPSMEEGELFLNVVYDVVPEYQSVLFLIFIIPSTLATVTVLRKKRGSY